MFGFEEVFQNRDLSLLFLRPPRHRVACDLIPLAVLKRQAWSRHERRPLVACDLIPLAVLKLLDLVGVRAPDGDVACDLIPLAVLKLQMPFSRSSVSTGRM